MTKSSESSEFSFGFQQEIRMVRTLLFHMLWCSENVKKMLANNRTIFSQYNIFDKYKYFVFQSVFWSKKVNQIRSNTVCVVARLVFVLCCTLTTGRCNAFQYIFVNQKKSEFYGPYIQTMLFLVTMIIDWKQLLWPS